MLIYLLLLLPQAKPEVAPVSGFLDEYRLYKVDQYLKETSPKQTKKGPILFPNDGPPQPKTPLIVTSRPLAESIARSELNTTAAPTEHNLDTQSYQPFFTNAQDQERAYPLYKLEPLSGLNKDQLTRKFSEPFPIPRIYNRYPTYISQRTTQKDTEPTSGYKPSKQKIKYIKFYTSNSLDDDDGNEDSNNNYAFSYKVRDNKTGDDFSHSQHSHGSATSGEYRVRLPDGRTQIVSYTADKNGYKADVRYDEGEKKTVFTNNYKFDQNYDIELNHGEYDNHAKYHDNKINHFNTNNNNNNNNNNLYPTSDNAVPVKQNNIYEYRSLHKNVDVPESSVANNEYNFQSVYTNNNQHNPLKENSKYEYTGHNKIDANPSVYPVPTIASPVKPVKEDNEEELLDDYGYTDSNKEYDDYLDELDYENKSYDYSPHKDKFNKYIDEQPNKNVGVIPIKPTIATRPSKIIDPYIPRSVRPTYDELKPLFAKPKPVVSHTKAIEDFIPVKSVRPTYEELKPLFFSTKPPTVFPTITYNGKARVEHHVPSTTPSSEGNAMSNEEVVVIGGKPLYTNIRQSLRMFQEPVFYSTPKNLLPVTPREFLVSTITSLRDRLTQATTPRPILSPTFFDRVNKYLKFI